MKCKSKGFTLVELMIATAITGIIFAGTYLIIRQSQFHIESILTQTNISQEGKIIYQTLSRFIYEAQDFKLINDKTIQLKVKTGTTTSSNVYIYYYEDTVNPNNPYNNSIIFDNDTNPNNGILDQFLNKNVLSIKKGANIEPIIKDVYPLSPTTPIFRDVLGNGTLLGLSFKIKKQLKITNQNRYFYVNTVINLRNS